MSGEDTLRTDYLSTYDQADEPKAKYQINLEKQKESQKVQSTKKKKGLCSRFFGATKAVFRSLDPFRPSLRLIESRFGGAVVSYFLFLRYLFYMNLIVVVLFLVLIVPAWQSDYESTCSFPLNNSTSANVTRYYGTEAQVCSRNYTESSLTNNSVDVIEIAFNLLQGTGFVEHSFAFLGYYCQKADFRTDLFFILVLCLAYLANFIIIVIESSRFFRKLALSLHAEYGSSFTSSVFAGWDFVIAEKQAARRRRRIWRNEIERMCRTQLEAAARGVLSRKERVKIILVRVLVTFVIIALQIGSAACIVAAQELASNQLVILSESDSNSDLTFWFLLFFEYLPSLVLSALNIVVPTLFRILLGWCSLTDDWQIRLRIISTIILRIFSLCVLVVNIFKSINYNCTAPKDSWHCGVCNSTISDCWETYFGQQMYKLMVLDLLLKFALWIALEVPRKLLSKIGKLKFITPKEFDIPTVVLDLVYLQTLCWVGMFFAPVLPLILFVGYMCLFALMMLSVFYTSSTESSMQTSKSTTFFAFVLSLLFAVVMLPLGTAMSKFQPSQSCSPFRVWLKENYTMIDSFTLWLSANDSGSLDVTQKFGVAVLWTIIMILVISYFWFRSQIQSKSKNIESLQVKLSKIGKDKQFLVNRLLEFNAFTGKA